MTVPLKVRPLPGAPFGVEIAGGDPGNLTASQRKQILDAHRAGQGLICFSFERLLEADELHALTAVFGDNEFAPGKIVGIGKGVGAGQEQRSVEQQAAALRARGDDPYMAYIGNLDPASLEEKRVDGKFYGEWEWHTDMSYIEVPPTFSLLHARVVPDEGGDTGFCSQTMAARDLPPALRERVVGREIKHDSTYGSSGVLRPGMTVPASPIDAIGHPHPVIRVVPETGQEALFLGRRTNAYVVGMEFDDSEQLLNELWRHATQPHFCYRHRWRVGQVVVWDNRMLLHMRHPMADDATRFMWRTQTRGEAVVPAVS
ncbi:MAG: TauD/TfdA family dioxygenase [Spirochaetaceae bacterium]|nr:TauD/TfdA family dioxygenase [Spirochaetaceae bacterium]